MFIVEANGFKYEVEIAHDLPVSDKATFEMWQMSKKEFRKMGFRTTCQVYVHNIALERFLRGFGEALLGYSDRFVCDKKIGARKAFNRAIQDFPRDVRKLFWQQYWEMEKTWV